MKPNPPSAGADVREVVLALTEEQRRMIAAELQPAQEASRVASANIQKLLRFLVPELAQPGSTLQFDIATGQVFRPAPGASAPQAPSPTE